MGDTTNIPPKKKEDEVPGTLMDAEEQETRAFIQARQEKLSRVAHEIEDIIIREGMTWGEWGEVVEMFSVRIGQLVAVTKIKFLDEK